MVFGLGFSRYLKTEEQAFQFPLGIRWCSDRHTGRGEAGKNLHFNSPWELDGVRTPNAAGDGIRNLHFNSPWELDGVRTNY